MEEIELVIKNKSLSAIERRRTDLEKTRKIRNPVIAEEKE